MLYVFFVYFPIPIAKRIIQKENRAIWQFRPWGGERTTKHCFPKVIVTEPMLISLIVFKITLHILSKSSHQHLIYEQISLFKVILVYTFSHTMPIVLLTRQNNGIYIKLIQHEFFKHVKHYQHLGDIKHCQRYSHSSGENGSYRLLFVTLMWSDGGD